MPPPGVTALCFFVLDLALTAAAFHDRPAPSTEPPSPLGAAHLRVKNGVYLGLRPGAVSKLDDSYF